MISQLAIVRTQESKTKVFFCFTSITAKKKAERAQEKERNTMMTAGGGELFSEDGWPVRAEIKKTGLCSQRSDPNRIRLGQKAR